jgi:hypothetical protein
MDSMQRTPKYSPIRCGVGKYAIQASRYPGLSNMRTKFRSRLGTDRGGKEKRISGYAGSGCSGAKGVCGGARPVFPGMGVASELLTFYSEGSVRTANAAPLHPKRSLKPFLSFL